VTEPIRVLYVGGESELAGGTATVLERENDRLRVATEPGASDALGRLVEDDFDCLVSEYDVPDTNGIEFLRTVREDRGDLPFVLLVGAGSEDIAATAISPGGADPIQEKAGTDRYGTLADRITFLVGQYREQAGPERHADRWRERDQSPRELREITSEPGRTPEEKIRRLLAVGCDRLGTDNGHLVVIDEDSGRHEVIGVQGDDIVQEGVAELSETYCRKTIGSDGILAVYDAPAQGWETDPAYEKYGLGCYIGTKLLVEDDLYGTLCFVSEQPRNEPFTPDEKAFLERLGSHVRQLVSEHILIVSDL